MSLRVLDPGLLALIEDEGRPGYAALGVGRSGAMDRGALRTANRLLGNAPDAAGIELLGAGFTARFDSDAWFSLAGGAGIATLDGRAVDRLLPALAPAGSVLRLGPLRAGLRRLLAIRGGVAVPAMLGSRSRDTLSALGPEPLRAGDELPIGAAPHPVRSVDWWPLDAPGPDVRLDVHPGPRLDRLPEGTWQRLLAGPWRVSGDADRVGIRLLGAPLPTGDAGELASEGLVHGSVQLPPSGRPVVFGPDHPVTGGYPVVAVVDSASLDLLAQLTPGSSVLLRAARRQG
ncbi:biotin-dependent carboxyltransferase family protein [Rathayibacter sp. VKM Ac-2754]|uniref:5-oxoprolinase subunit C family protein n=1 Tax=Rathayibacter sp. VKM Ac-2754 TaxID=2609251 RepID=UPI00135CF54A|nr:biotin-dependent carboxyltransferase family protein [Rathayibacter sp. VKM Ac-2754]MWV57278.1 5-oxoprolinase/urea amidolyase family protein [Rathayibacter sp. VKM Ac-2754]